MKPDNQHLRQEILKHLKRVVIKIGGSVIADCEKESAGLARGFSDATVRRIAAQVQRIVETGREVVLVSSGAVMAGRSRLSLQRQTLTIPEKQACAAVGQSFLMRTYERHFEKLGLRVAQILLDHFDLADRKRYLNAENTIATLLRHGVIPVINENDTVSVDEIKIGDNDTLAATVACLVDAQLLIILSDVEGLYTRDPSVKPSRQSPEVPELISLVTRVTPDLERLAGMRNSGLTVGGMYTKVLAAKKTMSFGVPTLVVNGLDPACLEKVFSGASTGTLFWSGKARIKNRKHWIAHTLKPAGRVIIDAGAKKAIVDRGKSLLPAGVVRVEGRFEFGNAVRILDEDQMEFARGLVNYGFRDLEQIKGMKTSAVRKLLGTGYYDEVVHRNDLVVL
ncbi:MAG: glutamate 5-kinase [Nitrospinales bacterium]